MRRFWTIYLGIIWLSLAVKAAAQPNVTSYAKMTAQLKADAARSPLVRVTSLGQTLKAHRDLWLVRIADPKADPEKSTRLLILCRQHGDEPASTEAILGLIHRVAGGGDPALRDSLSHLSLYFVPMVNPDGAEAGTRVNGVGADLNRDWGIFHQPETQAVARAVRLIRPTLVIDAHNWDGNDEYNADCLEVPRETETALGKAAHLLQQQSVDDLAACGYAVHPTAWGEDTNPHLAHRWLAQQNILSALVETHSGESTDLPDFQRRQGMYVALVHSLVRRYSIASAVGKATVPKETQESQLFPRLLPVAAPHRVLPMRRVPMGWFLALGVYGLALWGSKRKTEIVGLCAYESVLTPIARGRYSLKRKHDGTETKVRSGQRNAVSSPPR